MQFRMAVVDEKGQLQYLGRSNKRFMRILLAIGSPDDTKEPSENEDLVTRAMSLKKNKNKKTQTQIPPPLTPF